MHGFNGGGYGGGGDDDELTAAEAIQMLEYNLAHDRINAAEYVLGVMDLARRLSERLAESMTPQGSSNGYALPPNGIQEMCAKAVANSKQVIGRLKKTTEQNLDASAVRARGQLEASATQLVSTIVGATPGHTQSPEARRKADEAVAVFRGRLQALQTIRLKAEAAVADAVTAYKRRLEEVEAALTSTVGQAEQEREAIVAEFSKKARQRFEAAEAQVRQQTERRWGLGHRPLHAATPRAHGTVHRKVMGGTHGGRQHTGSRSMSSQQDLADIADLLA
jgi:F0F1-type ATP synthase membrane subunit b/b'